MELKYNDKGLIPVIAQDYDTREVLMLAYANEDALRRTFETGKAHYWSRSRRELWMKGGTSGNTQEIVEVRTDCDADTILYMVKQNGNACHTGNYSCFYTKLEDYG